MWLGLILGLCYCVTVFRGEGLPARVPATCGPLKDGFLVIRGVKVHHWMFALPASILCILIDEFNLFAFTVFMTVHGLAYQGNPSAVTKPVTAIEMDNVSVLDEDCDDVPVLDVLGAEKNEYNISD